MSYELRNPDFHARLKSLVGNEQPFSWAARVGISKGAFHRIWNEGTIPGPDHLVRIQEVTGISIDWLLTGKGEMRRGDRGEPSEVDQERMIQAVETVETALLETGRTMTTRKKGEMVAAVYAFFSDGAITEEVRSNVLRLIKSAA